MTEGDNTEAMTASVTDATIHADGDAVAGTNAQASASSAAAPTDAAESAAAATADATGNSVAEVSASANAATPADTTESASAEPPVSASAAAAADTAQGCVADVSDSATVVMQVDATESASAEPPVSASAAAAADTAQGCIADVSDSATVVMQVDATESAAAEPPVSASAAATADTTEGCIAEETLVAVDSLDAGASGTGGVETATGVSAGDAPKSDMSLSERMKERGLSLNSSSTAKDASHQKLAVSNAEQAQLFTPLASQGKKALEDEKRRKKETEQELLADVKQTLKKWVQECLTSEDKRKKLLEKGRLKCAVQATWSDGLHKKLKALVDSYGGKLAADGEKEGKEKKPAWVTAAELRKEKWLVTFDAAAFENFMRSHPEVVDPPEDGVRNVVKDFIFSHDIQAMRIKDLLEALQRKFGSLRRPLLDRAKSMCAEYIQEKMEMDEKKGEKRKKDGKGAGKGKKAESASKKARIERPEDVTWAEATLAPLGWRPDGEPVVKSPAAIAVPILHGLKDFQEFGEFRELLKSTQIGKVVNAFRKHPNSEAASTARQLVACWKAAIAQPVKKKQSSRRKSTEGNNPEGTNGNEVEGAPATTSATSEGAPGAETPKPDAIGEGEEVSESKNAVEESPAANGTEAIEEGGERKAQAETEEKAGKEDSQEMEDEPDEMDLFGSEDEAATGA